MNSNRHLPSIVGPVVVTFLNLNLDEPPAALLVGRVLPLGLDPLLEHHEVSPVPDVGRVLKVVHCNQSEHVFLIECCDSLDHNSYTNCPEVFHVTEFSELDKAVLPILAYLLVKTPEDPGVLQRKTDILILV